MEDPDYDFDDSKEPWVRLVIFNSTTLSYNQQPGYGFEAHEAHESGFREDKYKEWGYEDEYEDKLMKKMWI